MPDKDLTEKALEAYSDVFADIVNVLLFDGEQVVKPEDLAERGTESIYKADGRLRRQERDITKKWMMAWKICFAIFAFENQTDVDSDMPFRNIGYDGADYRDQLNDPDSKHRYPVVTLVLYFGYKKHWDKPTNLLGCMDVPERLKPYVNDYKMNLFEIAYLSDEQVKMFKSDFGIVADFFVQMRKTGRYEGSNKEMQHVQETLHLLSVMAKDKRFENVYVDDSQKGEPKNMCEVLDRIEARGRAEGKAQGLISLCVDMKMSLEETVKKLVKLLGMSPVDAKAAAKLYGGF